jgi:hypothetical protein
MVRTFFVFLLSHTAGRIAAFSVERRHMFQLVFILLSVLLLSAPVQAEPPLPLSIRNTAPTGLLFGVTPFRSEQRGPRVNVDHGNMFSGSNREGVETVFDGETTVASLSWNHVFDRSGRWSVGIEVPWIRHGGGVLDGFIEGYHEAFGFGDAGRNRVPRDRLLFGITEGGVPRLFLDDPESGIGDVRIRVGRQFLAAADKRFSVHAAVELPSGDADKLTGSGGTDVSLWAEYRQAGLFGFERLGVSVMAGAMIPGKSDLLDEYQEDAVPMGHLGFQYRVTDRIELIAQADGQGAPYDIASDVLGRSAVQGTLGGRIRLWNTVWLDLAVVEDLVSDSTPDVIFHFSLGAQHH